MANSIDTYTDRQIMKCLLTRDFAPMGRVFEDDKITKIKAGAFYQAQNLDRVAAPKVRDIDAVSFTGSGITQLDLEWEKLERIGYAAFMEAGSNILPENLNLASLTVLDSYAFAGSNDVPFPTVKSVSLPLWKGDRSPNIRYNVTNTSGRGYFSYLSSMTSFSAPELVTVPTYLIQRCHALTELILPKAASAPSNSFPNNNNLAKIKLGGEVTNLNSCPFNYCNKMEAFILSGITKVPSITANNWTNTRVGTGGCFIYVPASLVNTMKVTSGWSNFASQIRSIDDYPEICN